ncbi:hypothetical protein [Amycolatopsis palatopharyngis]|uniref:hypothetical protein n=1 Tax=Amycolatopsis palatopharyngis TaxID=187982 RepID=UPI000E243A67|nr:hypothetical protein [Amycolatopsis palatopharyngis]
MRTRDQHATPIAPASDEPGPEQRHRAVRAVASAAMDAQDCADLLAALGLSPEEGTRQVPAQRASTG